MVALGLPRARPRAGPRGLAVGSWRRSPGPLWRVVDGPGVAGVLAARSEAEARPHPPSLEDGHLTSCPTPTWSRTTKGSSGTSPARRYSARKLLSASSREMPHVVWVRSLVPKEKNSADRARAPGGQRGTRQLDHHAHGQAYIA